MRGFCLLATAFLCASLLDAQESDSGFEKGDEDAVVESSGEKREMDEILRPEVFARYERLPELDEVGKNFYRAFYRLPAAAYPGHHFRGNVPGIQEWLEKEGVKFAEGASVRFDPETRILEVVQTIHQLTKVELFLARFGGTHDVTVRLEIFEFPLMQGWELVSSAAGLFNQIPIRESAHDLVKSGEGTIVELLAAKLKSGERGKISWSKISDEGEVDDAYPSDYFEFDAISGPTGISGGTDPRIQVNFVFARSHGRYAPRYITSVVSFPSQGSAVAGSWREGDKLQVLFLSGEVRTVNGVTRVRKIARE